MDNFDTNSDGKLSNSELGNIKVIEPGVGSAPGLLDKRFTNLKGIEYFYALEELRLYWGTSELTSLDVSHNPKLKILFVYNDVYYDGWREDWAMLNNLTSLDLSNNPELEELDVSGNLLTSLDLSNNPNLKKVWVVANDISNLNISNNPNLEYLDCSNNLLSSINLSGTPNLSDLYCDEGITIIGAPSGININDGQG